MALSRIVSCSSGRRSVFQLTTAASTHCQFSFLHGYVRAYSSSSSSSSNSGASSSAVPVVDISKTFHSSAERLRIGGVFDEIGREIGFATIVGHNIPKELITRTWQITKEYFDLPVSEKKKVAMSEDYPYGYSGFLEENLSTGHVGAAVRPADLKESFSVGPYNPAAGMPPQRWPEQPQSLHVLWLAYYQAMEQLSSHLLSLFALGLHLPAEWFASKIDRHRSALRALNYPQHNEKPKEGQLRASPHTDYGTLTILRQDDVGGLQVQTRSGEWVDVRPMDDAFVINIGDLMARWTNDQWISTLHRVKEPPASQRPDGSWFMKRRQSMAFFHNINADQLVECIPTTVTNDRPPRYEAQTAWHLLMQKHSKAVKY